MDNKLTPSSEVDNKIKQKELEALLEEALEIATQIQEIENGRLALLQKAFSTYKKKLKKEMQAASLSKLETSKGHATFYHSKGARKLDIKALVSEYGTDVVDSFMVEGKGADIIRIVLGKEENTSITED